MRLRYYISGHGLGHASRSLQIIGTLRRRHPQLAVEIVSRAAPWFLHGAAPGGVAIRPAAFDIGVIQRDSLEMDLPATCRAWQELFARRPQLLAAEAESLARGGVSLVVADIPALPLAAARQAGIPAVGLSNFTWDWICRGFVAEEPAFAEIAATLAGDYAAADRILALPFSAGLPPGPSVEHLPLVARRASRPPRDTRRALGLPADKRVALISFGGFGLGDFDFSPLGRLTSWVFLSEPALAGQAPNLRVIPPGSCHYPDLVAAADVVVTKPGYGIVSEAIANQTAVLYTERGSFREQSLLIAALHRYTRALAIDNRRLRCGEWGEALETLVRQPAPAETLAADGDVVAADRLADLAGPGRGAAEPSPPPRGGPA